MSTKQNKFILASIIILVVLIGGAYAYTHRVTLAENKIPYCLEMQSGIVRLRVQYPENLVIGQGAFSIALKRKDAPDKNYIFGTEVQIPYYESLNDLIWHEQGGTNYSSSTFNTLEAGEYRLKDGNIDWDSYIIPIGNRVIHLYFQYTDLSPNDRPAVEKMIKDIRISTSTEDIKDTRVVDCPD
jgi:hypothetical protein